MHSSRMRTGRSLTICRSLLPRGACFPGGCLLLGGVCSQGGYLLPRGSASQGGLLPAGGIPACTEADPPINRITDTSKNITLATTSLRPVSIVQIKFIKKFRLSHNFFKRSQNGNELPRSFIGVG